MLESLISFTAATILLAISPGPDNIYVLTQSLAHGSKSGLATTAGLVSGCIVHTSLLAFGVSAILTASPFVFYGIKMLGAAYLFYLAFKVYKSNASIAFAENAPKKSHLALFKQGVIMNLLNPKVMIFFLALFPGFLWNLEGETVSQFYILGITFMVVSFIVFGGIAILAGNISSFILKNKRIGIVLKWLQILVFIGIGVYILI